ncbi:phosphotransferase [Methylobacterium nonmethylotrophicum]|uniref:Phosphotransferase family protein n=1 Tax=Methylobacterium nonmethylotrophicum TaxID=1141884 RepID=A0A4Z0NWK6_9HYPH|nr:phosphotransferase [Methylobacterium nonmethylotrophicum]TGE01649.1 phosphotransferase family protein [Methylobacterium nonmethylotrophicum]
MAEAVLVPVLDNHRFDEAGLQRYLAPRLPGAGDGLVVRQFQGGQSNPTFHLATPGGAYVLRKKPGGVLLPSAHAVDREYRVLGALAATDVPVPRARLYCDDPAVIGTPFYVMDHLAGRVYPERDMPGVDPEHRRAAFLDAARILGRLHRIDPAAIGLADYGRPGNYIERQVARWTKQYRAADLAPEPAMDRLIAWLAAHASVPDETRIAHGDYRLGNLMLHPDEPRVIAVLDWELSTLGHPLADLAYCLLPWRTTPAEQGLMGRDVPGLPREAEFVAAYSEAAGRPVPADLDVFVVFSLFRWAAIVAGVYRRALDGNASDANAVHVAGEKFRRLARRGEEIAHGR